MARFIKGFGRFWYDFIVGDDWKIAAFVVLALGIGALLAASDALGETGVVLVGAAAVAIGFATSLVIDIRAR
jgi:hypothetical protein